MGNAGDFLVVNKTKNYVFDLTGGNAEPGTGIIAHKELPNNRNQHWIIIENDDGTISFKNTLADSYICAPRNLPPGGKDPDSFEAGQCVGGPAGSDYAKWVKIATGDFYIFASYKYPGKVIDLLKSDKDGSPILCWPTNGRDNQLWKLSRNF